MFLTHEVEDMQAQNELLTIAQIAIAVIGFSGIIATFRRTPYLEWPLRDRMTLGLILYIGSTTFLFALLPLPFFYVNVPSGNLLDPITWNYIQLFLACFIIFGMGAIIYIDLKHGKDRARLRKVVNIISIVLNSVLVLMLLLSWLDIILHDVSIYLAVLIFRLLLSIMYFVIFLLRDA